MSSISSDQPSHYSDDQTWTTINQRPLPSWFSIQSTGILIHFGIYSVTAFHRFHPSKNGKAINNGSEWYLERLNKASRFYDRVTRDYHQKTFGNRNYFDIANDLHVTAIDIDQWVQTFKAAGMAYVLITARHHDGFALWDTSYPGKIMEGKPLSSVHFGPKLDIVEAVALACQKYELVFGIYYSLLEWRNMTYCQDRELLVKGSSNLCEYSTYTNTVVYPQLKELIDRYRPKILWVDGGWQVNANFWKAKDILSYYFHQVPDGMTNDRWGKECHGIHGNLVTGSDRTIVPTGQLESKTQVPQLVIPISQSWAYNQEDDPCQALDIETYKKYKKECNEKNCSLLLGVGPTGNGKLSMADQRLLKALVNKR